MLCRVVAWLGVACLVGTSAQISGKNQVYCKKTPDRGTGKSSDILTGDKCELDLLLVASAAGPGKDIKFYFQVNRPASFVPVPVYDSISGRATDLAEIESGYVGLVPANFDITKIGRIDSIRFQNSSVLVRKNFSDVGVETLLEPQKAVSVAVNDSYKALGWFRVTDRATNSTNEYVAIRDNVEIKEVKAVEFRTILYDDKTTYCWRTTNASKFDGLAYDEQTFDSSCPVTIAVVNPRVAKNLSPFSVAWTMRVVPNYLQTGGKGVYSLGLSDDAANVAPILHTTVHLCSIEDDTLCHIFSPKPYALSSVDLTGAFTAGQAAFTAPGLELTKGEYVGFVHGVVAKADGSLLHVATYFTIKVDEKQAKVADAVAQVVNKTYCWKVFAAASARDVTAMSALGGYSVDDSCPMALKLNIPTQLSTNSSLVVVPQAIPSPVKSSVVTVAMLPEGFAISLATLSVCRSNATCGPLTTFVPASGSSVVDVKAASATAFAPATLEFRQAGSYNVYFVATVDVGKGVRLDLSVMSTIQVQDAVAPVNNTTLYIAIVGGVVGFLLLVAVIWCCVSRQRKARWDRHRLQRGTMTFKEDQTPTRVHSSIPMVNQRGGITEVPRLYDDADVAQANNPKLDLGVSHYMYNQDTRRVDEHPPRRVTSQYDPRTSLGYDAPPPHDDGVHLGYEDYGHQHDHHLQYHHEIQDNRRPHGSDAPRRAKSARQPEDFRDHQLVLRDEYRFDQPNQRQLALHAHNPVADDDFLYETNNMSPSSVRNNYGGYDVSFGGSSADDRPYYR